MLMPFCYTAFVRLKLELQRYEEYYSSKDIFNWTRSVFQSQLQQYFLDSDDKILALLWMFGEFSHASNLLMHRFSDFSQFCYFADSMHCIIFYTGEKNGIFKKEICVTFCAHNNHQIIHIACDKIMPSPENVLLVHSWSATKDLNSLCLDVLLTLFL